MIFQFCIHLMYLYIFYAFLSPGGLFKCGSVRIRIQIRNTEYSAVQESTVHYILQYTIILCIYTVAELWALWSKLLAFCELDLLYPSWLALVKASFVLSPFNLFLIIALFIPNRWPFLFLIDGPFYS